MTTRTAIRRAVAGAISVAAALAATAASAGATAASAGAATPRPSPTASCVATITVAETQITPGFVGEEVRRIVELGPDVLPSLVRSLAGAHLGDPEACAALAAE
jgi:hypothetical protein